MKYTETMTFAPGSVSLPSGQTLSPQTKHMRAAVVNGGAPMSPEVAPRVIRLFCEIRPPVRANYELSPHEVRLLKLLAEGHSYRTAAAELGVSAHTVSFHLRSVYDKLQVHSKSEAVGKAFRHGLIQ